MERRAERTPDATASATAVLERMLSRDIDAGGLEEQRITAWSAGAGTLADGRAVRASASCLLRPQTGDHVLVWSGERAGAWVLAVLWRAEGGEDAVLASPVPVTLEAPRVGIAGQTVHVAAEEFISNARRRHAVEDVRTETSKLKVSVTGTEVNQATTRSDTVGGTLLQKIGTWIAHTRCEARIRARTMLFD